MICSLSKPLILGFWRNAHDQDTNLLSRPLMIALQDVRTPFGFYLRACWEVVSSPPPPPLILVLHEKQPFLDRDWKQCARAVCYPLSCFSISSFAGPPEKRDYLENFHPRSRHHSTGIPANRAGSVVIQSQSWFLFRLTKVQGRSLQSEPARLM